MAACDLVRWSIFPQGGMVVDWEDVIICRKLGIVEEENVALEGSLFS